MEGLPIALGLAEAALNRYLRLDAEALNALSEFAGKTVALELLGLGRTVLILISPEGVHLSSNADHAPDALLRAPPGALLRALAAHESSASAFDPEMVIEGDMALVQGLRRVFDRVDVDWEEVMSRAFGDVLSHQLGNLARGAARWGSQTGRTLMQDMAEYLTEEGRHTPQADELDGFVKAVDRLRDDAERLEQRVRRLEDEQTEDKS